MPERPRVRVFHPRLPLLALLGILVLILGEVALLVWVTNLIGWWTLAVMMVSTVLGAYLLQREWRKAWRQLRESLQTGSLPTGRAADAVLVLVGGLLLILPGFGTDVIGILLLLPFTRPGIRSLLGWWASRTLAHNTTSPRDTVIRGDVMDTDDSEPRTGTILPPISPVEEDPEDS